MPSFCGALDPKRVGSAVAAQLDPTQGHAAQSNLLAQIWLWFPNCPSNRSSVPGYITCLVHLDLQYALCIRQRDSHGQIYKVLKQKPMQQELWKYLFWVYSMLLFALQTQQGMSLQELNLFISLNLKSHAWLIYMNRSECHHLCKALWAGPLATHARGASGRWTGRAGLNPSCLMGSQMCP